MSKAPMEFVFSFRSPYAWFAAECVVPRIPCAESIRWLPFYPLPEFENFSTSPLPAKTRYLIKDVTRLADFYGIGPMGWPPIVEPDWSVPHAAFVRADELGAGPDFARAVYAARWQRGEDIADEAVLRAAAEQAGTDANAVLEAAFDVAGQHALAATIRAAYEHRGIFGVPTLITPWKTRFWGHDRIEWALGQGLLAAPRAETR